MKKNKKSKQCLQICEKERTSKIETIKNNNNTDRQKKLPVWLKAMRNCHNWAREVSEIIVPRVEKLESEKKTERIKFQKR